MPKPSDTVISRQHEWAASRGLEADPSNPSYLAKAADNLFQPLSKVTRGNLTRAGGSELVDKERSLAKIKALHSSATLVVNMFDYWVERDTARLARALGLDSEIQNLTLEVKCPSGLGGTPPHLDLVIRQENEIIIGVESKFTEWMTPKAFQPTYFPSSKAYWGDRGLHECQSLADSIYNYLDIVQLLKHALGLYNTYGKNFRLMYIYYDANGREGELHRAEIERFNQHVGAELGFEAISYQELFRRLQTEVGLGDAAYAEYLRERYF